MRPECTGHYEHLVHIFLHNLSHLSQWLKILLNLYSPPHQHFSFVTEVDLKGEISKLLPGFTWSDYESLMSCTLSGLYQVCPVSCLIEITISSQVA